MNQVEKFFRIAALLSVSCIAVLSSSTAFAYDITQEITGSWYNAEESGHGVILEVMPDNQLLAYWFVYDPDGNQAWFVGSGNIQGDSASIPLIKTNGGIFGNNFDPTTVVREDWGNLNLSFSSCNAGIASYSTNYGSGSLPIQRLTSVSGLPCTEPVKAGSNVGTIIKGILIESESLETSEFTTTCKITVQVKNTTDVAVDVFLSYNGYNSASIIIDDALVTVFSLPAGASAIDSGTFFKKSCEDFIRYEVDPTSHVFERR